MQDYFKLLKAGTLGASRVFVLSGNDPYIGRKVTSLIVKLFSGSTPIRPQTIDYSQYENGKSSAMKKIVAEVATPSLFAARQITRIENCDSVFDTATESQVVTAFATLKQDLSVLIFYPTKIDKRLKVFKALDNGIVETQGPKYERDLAPWLAEIAGEYRVKIAPNATERLIARAGTDVGQIASHIEKLSVIAEGTITLDLVEENVSETREEIIFGFFDAALSKQPGKALAVLRNLLGANVSVFELLGAVSSQVRSAINIREAIAVCGPREDAIAAHLGLNPYVVKRNLPLARRTSTPILLSVLARLAHIDEGVKRGQMRDFETALFAMVAELAI